MGSVCGNLVKLCGFCCTQLAQRLPFQVEPVSAVDQSIEHGIGDVCMPVLDWQLAGNDGGSATMAVVDDL
jgi:hypothetical protein